MKSTRAKHDHSDLCGRLRRGVVRIAFVNAILLGLLMAGLNALKPLHIDDNQYVIQARHIAQHWADPYGYTMSGLIWREPGMDIVSPPVIPYWLATCVATVGDGELTLKLWMLPWCVLWAFAAGMLTIRVAPRVSLFVTWFIGLSPWVLPGINLMLDVPAQGLMMLSVEVICRAVERTGLGNFSLAAMPAPMQNGGGDASHSQRVEMNDPARSEAERRRDRFVALGWAALAGLLAAVAIQTKYTGLACVPLLAVIGVGTGRWREAIVAVGVAVAGFAGWEFAMSRQYGVSHFINIMQLNNTLTQSSASSVWLGLLTQTGGLGLPVVVLAVWGFTRSRWARIVATVIAVGWLGWLLVAPMAMEVYKFAGAVFWAAVAVCVVRLAMICRSPTRIKLPGSGFGLDHFLIAWLVVECICTVTISPFPAARRVMGVLLVATLIAARLVEHRLRNATDTDASSERSTSRAAFGVAIVSGLFGLMFFTTDRRDATAIREAYRDAADAIRAQSPDARIWFLGFWSPKYYGPKFGMDELMLEESRGHRGDYIVFPIAGVFRPEPYFLNEQVREVRIVTRGDTLPMQTVPGYYGGLLPITHRNDPKHPRVRLAILQATADFTALSGVDEGTLKAWIMKRRGAVPVWAVRPLGNLVSPSDRVLSEKIISTFDASGAEVIAQAATTENPRVRLWAVTRMGERLADREAWREPLRAAINDREAIIRDAAAKSVEALGLKDAPPR